MTRAADRLLHASEADGHAGVGGMTPLLRLRGLRLDAATPRGPARILRGVDLDVGRGRIVGVVGESGSGKSSLALALLRLLPGGVRLSGQAVMNGTDLAALAEADMDHWRGQRIAMIFQDPATALNPLFTVGAHLTGVLRRREPGLTRAARRGQAEAALRRVEIADPARRLRAYPHELSGGMRQRVMIAMGLLARPALLLADEPTTALDATVEAGVVELFRGLRADLGGSILFISHDLGLVAGLCDDIAVLYGGLVLETGPAAAVVAAPAHPYTAALLACTLEGAGSGRLPSIPGDVPDPTLELVGCIFAPRCPLAEGRCRAEPQALRPVGPDHAAACWKAVPGGAG
jgi:peptide/nickel transport system ATP-binding protein